MLAGKRASHKRSSFTPRWTSTSLRILGVLLVSPPNVPLVIIMESTPSVMELMPGFMARPSCGLLEAGERSEGAGDASKECSSRLLSCMRCLVDNQTLIQTTRTPEREARKQFIYNISDFSPGFRAVFPGVEASSFTLQ